MGQIAVVNIVSSTIWLLGNIAFFALVLLVLKSAAKLKWRTSICLAFLAMTILMIFGFRLFPGPQFKMGMIFLLPAAVCVVILLIDFLQWIFSGENKSVSADERAKILRMVEDGKIGAEEASGLLDAMGRADAFMAQDKFSRLDIVMLVGVALVVLGFFMPWSTIRIRQLPGFFGNISGYQAGYHLKAIGWAVLIVGIASAIPVFVTPKDYLYKISMMQIFLNIIGIVLVVSLLIQVGNRVGVGLIMCLVGFIIGIFAAAAKFKKLAA
jgi:hypothetical protein